MAATPITPLEPGAEMFMRAKTQSLLAVRTDKPRPVSEATEIFDTDFDDESEFEEDSPKYSFESSRSRRSQTTISTYEEVQTPRSTRRPQWPLVAGAKPVEGPRGPHLFRQSVSSSEFAFDYALQMSPVLPKHLPERIETAFREREQTATVTPPEQRPFGTLPETYNLDSNEIRMWSSSQVASWMYQLGFEEFIIDKFEQHDITGAVLLDLQFEDLKELEIPSFGKRHQLWNEIGNLREHDGAPVSPVATPFQDISRPCTRNTRSDSKARGRGRSKGRNDSCNRNASEDPLPRNTSKRRGRRNASRDPFGDVITPAESVSIVAIEQLLPKPHKCAKGERCAKWRKQQKLIQRLHDEHGFPISPEKGGHIFVAGDPGNVATATPVVDRVRRQEIDVRPTSDAVPSVVASSDLLGPGQTPRVAPLHADSLAAVASRDPQDNVKQFLDFQHIDPPAMFDAPPTPLDEPYIHYKHNSVPVQQHNYWQPPSPDSEEPLPLFPPLQTTAPIGSQNLNSNLNSLPRLAIPRSASAAPYMPAQNQYQQQLPPQYVGNHSLRPAGPDISTFSPCRSATVSPGNMDPDALYRFGTPASEMDAPLTAVPIGPVSRDTSQSVPPNMQYRDPINRSNSRSVANDWRRPSFAMPALNEGQVYSMRDDDASDVSTLFQEEQSVVDVHAIDEVGEIYEASIMPVFEAPPTKPITTSSGRGKLIKRSASKKSAARSSTGMLSVSGEGSAALAAQPHKLAYAGVNHHGWMKKRHTKLLRHEWRDHHFRLTGTQLAMHPDALPQSRALDTIDVDNYAVGCSQIASSKLAAKLKALKLNGSEKNPGNGTEAAAFSFQLVPAKEDGSGEKKLVASGKTHHFAVKTRDERIDWMRELMLAKALKAKGDGYEVKVNGSVV